MSKYLLLLIAACLLVPPAFASKDFLAIKGWGNIGDPDGDCAIGIKDGSVTFTIPGSAHDYAAELQRWNAPRIISTVRGDFVAEVKITGSFDPKKHSTIPGHKPYNGAGILVVADPQNHLSLQRAAYFEGDHVRHYLNFELRQDGECTVSRGNIELNETDDTFLRVERHGKKIFGSASQDGINWHSYKPIEVNFPADLDVGVEAVNSSANSFDCAFEQYELFRSSSAKIWNAQGADERKPTHQVPAADLPNPKPFDLHSRVEGNSEKQPAPKADEKSKTEPDDEDN